MPCCGPKSVVKFKPDIGSQNVRRVTQIGHNGRLVADEADALAADEIDLFIQKAFDTETVRMLVRFLK